MGQKVNPSLIRLNITKEPCSRWYTKKRSEYADTLYNDYLIRTYLEKELAHASVGEIFIERQSNRCVVTIHTARPGIVIGKKGEDVEKLKKQISKISGVSVQVNIEEIKKPEMHSKLVAELIAQQLEKRIMFRRAMKRAVSNALRAGAQGVKVCISGRLGGAEIARREWYREGRVPLHTFRADIDYGVAEAKTTYGIIGIKVWIYKGEVLGSREKKHAKPIEDFTGRKNAATDTNNEHKEE